MKKVGFLLLTAILMFPTVDLSAKSKAKTSVAMTTNDSVSYAIGVEFARSVRENMSHFPGGPFNEKLLLEAFDKTFNNDTVDLTVKTNQTSELIQRYMRTEQEKQAEKAKAEGKTFLENNKKNPAVKETASGLQYEVIKEGTGIKPSASDRVKVHYTGTLLDGTVFDSSVQRGEPATFELNKVIPGWTEGVQLMSIGSKYRFFVPSELAYGARGAGSIPPFSTLIFEVELLDVAKATVAPASNGAKYQFPAYQRTGK